MYTKLINLPTKVKQTKITWIYFGEWRGYWFRPSGIETLAGYVKQNHQGDVKHNIWYYSKAEINNLLESIEKNQPEVLGFSVTIGHLNQSLEIYNIINDFYETHPHIKRAKITFGNVEFADQESIKKVLTSAPEAVVVSGEGEESLLKIIEDEQKPNIPNSYYSNVNGQIIHTYNEKLDEEKSATQLKVDDVINPTQPDFANIAYVEESRGCNKKSPCTFCSNSMNHKNNKWRALKFKTVFSNILANAEMNPVAINITSEDFGGGNPELIRSYLKTIQEIRIQRNQLVDTHFYASMRVPSIYDPKRSDAENKEGRRLLSEMHNTGFTTLFYGFESGSDTQLRRYNKGVTAAQNEKVIKIMQKEGMHIDGGMIMFDPLMTLDEAKENISFMRRTSVPKLMIFPFNRLIVFPNTAYSKLYESRKDKISPEVKKLTSIVENELESLWDIKLLEKFLQKLRLLYFEDKNQIAIKVFEEKAMEHGNLFLSFLEKLVSQLEQQKPTDKLIADFKVSYKKYLSDLTVFLNEQKQLENQSQKELVHHEK